MSKEKKVQSYFQNTLLPSSVTVQDMPHSGNTAIDFKNLLKPQKTFRIAVSGDVQVTRLEREIIDTLDFQRLGGVRQLGTVVHVFRTALHTRFDHSLGTLAMVDRMMRAIATNAHSSKEESLISPEQEVLARLYALLHDLPHVPFGHTIEDELGLILRHDQNPKRLLRFLGPESRIGSIIKDNLGQAMYDRFLSIYLWEEDKTWQKRREEIAERDSDQAKLWDKLEYWSDLKDSDDAFIHDLVSNTVCADLLDYIARDNYFCNLGGAMEYRFINFLYLHQNANGRRRLFVRLWKKRKTEPRRDTLTDLTRLLEARYLLAERAYFHHAKIISGAMLGRAVQEEMLAGKLDEEDLYSHTDDSLLYSLARSSAPNVRRLATALQERRLHRTFRKYLEEDFKTMQSHDHSVNQEEIIKARFINPIARREIEDNLAEEIGVQAGDVIIYAPPLDMNMKVADMKVIWNGKELSLKNVDDPVIKPRLTQILDAHRRLWGISIITSRELTSDQEDLLDRACRLTFSCEKDKEDQVRREYYQAIVKARVLTNGESTRLTPGEYELALSGAAAELFATKTDKRPFQGRLDSAIKKHFSRAASVTDAGLTS